MTVVVLKLASWILGEGFWLSLTVLSLEQATLHDSRLMANYALGGYPGQPSWAQGMPPSPYATVPLNPMAY